MSRWTQIALLVVAILLTGVVMLVVAVDRYRSRPENIVVHPVGQEVQYDDFAFSVVASREAPELAEAHDAPQPSGRFILVTLRVANHARRVDFRFKPSNIRLADERDVEFRLSAGGMAALRAMETDGCADALPAGATCTTDLVFDVPAGATGLRALVGSNTGLLGMLDRVIYGKQFLDLN